MKRTICALLTLIMLLSVMPMSASAANMNVSENAITVLKNLQKYNDECIQIGTEFRTGYGTICTTCTKAGSRQTHGYSEKKADQDLRAKLDEVEVAVNAFATANPSANLNQNKFDALVLISYDIGTSWLNGDGVLKSAVVNGLTGNAFLNAIGQSSALGSDQTDKISGQARRMVEGNMYLNGTYSDTKPSSYGWVKYVINDTYTGAVMAEGSNNEYVQYFDSYTAAKPAPVPTRAGYTFLGWYMIDHDTISWVSTLAGWQVENNGKTLYAKWQHNASVTSKNDYSQALTTYNWLDPKVIASKTIYENPVSQKAVGTHTDYRVMIDRDFIDSKGNRWGRLMEGGTGWVLVSGSAASSSDHDIDVTVTVTNSFVNGRANATAASAHLKTFYQGEQLRIISTATSGNQLWGQVADKNGEAICWVCLMYTNWNDVKDKGNDSSSNTKAIANAVINCQGYLNVRSEAGTDNAIVGALADGDHVEIYEIKFVNGHKWGRISSGWILLTYAKVEMIEGNNASFVNTSDVLAYTFTGKLKNNVTAHVDVMHGSETIGDEMKAGTPVAVSMVKNGPTDQAPSDVGVWGFNGIGWIHMNDINMDEAKYVVVADGVTVRNNYANDAGIVEKVSKGVELNISEIAVVDATIWGKTEKYGGWVNLASKFVQRSNAPVIENVTGSVKSDWVATVVNTDEVNVRANDTATSARTGGLSRGTVVRVWSHNDDDGKWENATWYRVDSNQNNMLDEDIDGWVSAQYLTLSWSPLGQETTEGGNDTATTPAVIETGLGVVANTYSGVNIRTGAGTGYAATGKYLNGTAVEILEVTSTGTSKWGRTAKGWVCMDYINMVNKYAIGGTTTDTATTPTGPNAGGSTSTTEGNVTFDSTPVSYTGRITTAEVELKKTPDQDAIVTGTLTAGTNVTLQELRKVTTKITASGGEVVDGNGTTENLTVTTSITYWGRINGGWIEYPGSHISLDALEEMVYTNVNDTDVDVYSAPGTGSPITEVDKGTQVTITALQIVDDKVWGQAQDIGTSGGWIRLDKLSQGAHTIQETQPTQPPANNGAGTGGSNFTLGTGSDTTGTVPTGGYRYTGKVINTNAVNVRATPSTNAAITTQIKAGGALVIYETQTAENMAWGRCDAGWVYLYYVDLTPTTGAVDARVVYNDNAVYYSDMNGTNAIGTYARMSVIDIYEIVGTMARTNQGWVSTNDLL